MLEKIPLVTVIILLWKNEEHLPICLEKLTLQSLSDFEVLVVNNGSEGGWLDSLKNDNLYFYHLNDNLGFAAANNIGVKMAHGKWIVLLNADAYPEPDWLENLVRAAEQNPQYNFFTSRQIQYNTPHLLDGAGDEYHVSGLAWRRFYNYPEEEHGMNRDEVFGVCAAAAMYRKEDFLKVGGFDEDYFSYFEDVDLSFRLRLAGGRCLYVPDAVVHHVGSASTGKLSDFVVYHGHRNLVWTFIKDMPGILFWLYLPLHLAMNIFFLLSFTLKGKGSAIFRAKWDAIRGIPAVIRKRRECQNLRKAPVKDIYHFMRKGILDPYWASRQRKRHA